MKWKPGAGQGAYRCCAPEGCCRLHPLDRKPGAQDAPAAQEPDTADDVRRDAGRAVVIAHQFRQGYEKGGADADQGVGSEARDMLLDLTLHSDGDSHKDRNADIEDEMKDIHSLSQ